MILIKVEHEGNDYVFDAENPEPEFYMTYDSDIMTRIDKLTEEVLLNGNFYVVDPTDAYLDALRDEFGNAELIASNWEPGKVY